MGTGGRRPSLDLIHTELPHVPDVYLPSGQTYVTDNEGLPGATRDLWGPDMDLIRQGRQRYLLQLAYVDRLLGDLVDRLQATGVWDRALVVVTADHGVAFQPETSRRAIEDATFARIAGVRLFVKAPGQRHGRTDDRAARSVDVLPTIADHLGLRLPWKSDGRSLRGPAPPESRPIHVFAKYGPPFELPFAEFVRRRDAAVRLEAATGGAGDDGRGMFTGAGEAELIGRPVADVPTGRAGTARGRLDGTQAFSDVNPGGPAVPVVVSGTLDGMPAGRALAVALNGRIAATATTTDDGSGVRFSAIVDPRLLRRGANRFGLYALAGPPGDRRLTSLGAEAGDYRLVSDALVDGS